MSITRPANRDDCPAGGRSPLILPAMLTVGLMLIVILAALFPIRQEVLSWRQRGMVRDRTGSVWSSLVCYARLEDQGRLTRQEAQQEGPEARPEGSV